MKKNYLLLKSILLAVLIGMTSLSSLAQHTQLSQQNKNGINHPVHQLTINNSGGIQMGIQAPVSPVLQTNGNRCISDALMENYLTQSGLKAQFEAQYQQMVSNIDYSGNTPKAIYTIPVIFHVIYNTGAQNVSNAAIMGIFNQLNQDYQLQNADQGNARSQYGFTPANVDVSFCLAQRDPQNNPLAEPGVHRVSTTEAYFDPDTESNDMKSTPKGTPGWDHTKYMNVWICNISNGVGYGVAGYAYLPTTGSIPPASIDGIVIDYDMGLVPSNRVLTHETGHFLGLPHTWGSTDGQGCSNGNDGIGDTPDTKGPSFNYANSCNGDQQTCSGTHTQYENYMDYSNCTCMFTTGQVSIMQQILATSRNSLTTSNACVPVNPTPPVADFIADITTVVSGGTVNFTDLSTNFPTSWSWAITPSTGWNYVAPSSATSQNPKVMFTTPGQYTVALTATNGSGVDTETKTNYITVVASGGGTIACDTLRNYTAAELNNATYYGLTGETGFYPGYHTLSSGTVKSSRIAEKFTAVSASQMRALRVVVMKAYDMGAANNITFKVYQDNAGYPGTAIASETRTIASLDSLSWNTIEFATPASVSGVFWVGMEWSTSGTFDSLTFLTTDFSDRPSGQSSTAEYLGATYNWLRADEFFNGAPNTSLIMDALLSNGPAPTAVMSINPTETCVNTDVNVNGFASSNTSDYLWQFTNGATNYYGTGGNITFNNLPVGNWNVQLFAMGSCMTDAANGTLLIHPAITPNVSSTPENCSAEDGSITVAPTGGNGGPYNVSTNSGATFDSSAPYSFTNLGAGTYTTIVNDGTGGCSDTISVTVANVNTFNPTVSPGTSVSINAGDNVTFTVNSGVSWTWYQNLGGTYVTVGTTQSMNFAPTVTTIYTVEVTDANGCTKTITITVTVNGTKPVVNFVADDSTINVNGTVNFTDLSTNTPTAWTWTITPNTGVTYVSSTSAASQNPIVQFANTGLYTVKLRASNASGADSLTKINYINVTQTNGIDEYGLSNSINVYPNPSNGVFNLNVSFAEAQTLHVKVYSLIGALVFEQSQKEVKNAVIPINLSEKGNGAYLLQITSKNGTVTKRIVLSR
jgi:PKD repeat protein